ncbi:MAG: GcrA family cell cycle regulator [Candidatus Puniceispirillaceae bacterium]
MSETLKWTDERLSQLRTLWDEGLSISQIGEKMGVSRNAIAGKVHRMKLPKRSSPVSKSAKSAEPVAEPEELPLRRSLRKIKWSRSKCAWPSGDPKTTEFSFCGEPILAGKPYCAEHCEMAYTTSRDGS